MRRILCIVAIVTGIASASSAETSYKACLLDDQIKFFGFSNAGDFVEITAFDSIPSSFSRPNNSALIIEVKDDVIIFGNEKAFLVNGDSITDLDCYPVWITQIAALTAQHEGDLEFRLASAILAQQTAEERIAAVLVEKQERTARMYEAIAARDHFKSKVQALESKVVALEFEVEELLAPQDESALVVELRRQIVELQDQIAISTEDLSMASKRISSLSADLNSATVRIANEQLQRRALERLLEAGQASN